MVVCQSCGFANQGGIKFCGECGARLPSAAQVGGRERKVVSVLFCDLVGFTAASDGADPEEVQAALSPYHARARIEIERFGGTVEKFIGDAVMAAFGAPVVHEDDPERAVRAGLALLEAVADLNRSHGLDLAIRVGVATGEAVVSTGARPERGEAMLAGDVVNTAARLQTSAPVGAVLVGQSTRDATQATIEYEPHAAVTVKGKAGPLSVWVAVRPRGSAGDALTDTTRPMIGREDELTVLQRAFSRAVRESSVQLVTIVAEPGLGKSRLVQAFADWVDERDELITWRQGRCPSYGDAVTYAALGQVVKAQTGILDTDPAADATGKLTDTLRALVAGTDLAAQESWLVARLAPLVGLPAAETPQEELFTAWRRFLETLAATNPLVLVIEDLHWADAAMLKFLTHLLEWVVGVPLLIVTTTRPELFDTVEHWGSGHRNSSTITLSPLSDTENAQLVTSLLGTAVLPADLHAALLSRSAGNPLYTREYVNMVVDRIGGAGPPTETVALPADTLPGSVRAVIAARLDTLPAEHKQLLQAAAVVGHTFWEGAVAAVTDSDPAVVSTRLHDLVRRDYLRPSRTSSIAGQAEYTFNHALIADVAYSQLPRAVRATHHRHVGDWHADFTTPGDGLGDAAGWSGQAAVIAHHYTQAHALTETAGGNPDAVAELAARAATWHARAAQRAQQVDLNSAETHARAALGLTSRTDPAHADILVLLGEILMYGGNATESNAVCEQAHDEALTAGKPVAAALADVYRGDALRALARFDEARALIDGAIAVLEQHPLGPELAEAYVTSALGLAVEGSFSSAIDRANQALALAERLDHPSPRVVSGALYARGLASAWSGASSSEEDLIQALDIARSHSLTGSLININAEIASLKYLTESVQASIPYFEQALALAADRGRRSARLVIASNFAEYLAVAGRIDDALQVCASDDLAVAAGPRETMGLQLSWSWILTLRGDFDHAGALIDRALPVARGVEPIALIQALLVAVTCARACRDADAIDALTAELVATLPDPDAAGDLGNYLARIARILVPAGHVDLVSRLVEHTPAGMLVYANNAVSTRAILAEAGGHYGDAADLYNTAAVAWATYGYPLEQAQALLGAARCRLALDVPARDVLLDARRILTSLGAAPLLAETDALLAN